jgi:hypothetical protein
MWSERDRRYGGLNWRYREFEWARAECMDPLRKCSVAFRTELHYENWLLHWAIPEVKNLVPNSVSLTCLDYGVRRSIKPDLQFRRDGIEIQIVVPRHSSAYESRIYTLQRVAAAHDFQWSVRTPKLIRADPFLLDNLDRLRRSAMLYVDQRGEPVWSFVESFFDRTAVATRAELRERVGKKIPDGQVDAVLIRMHALGQVKIDLTEKLYGEDTKIYQCRAWSKPRT